MGYSTDTPNELQIPRMNYSYPEWIWERECPDPCSCVAVLHFRSPSMRGLGPNGQPLPQQQVVTEKINSARWLTRRILRHGNSKAHLCASAASGGWQILPALFRLFCSCTYIYFILFHFCFSLNCFCVFCIFSSSSLFLFFSERYRFVVPCVNSSYDHG